MNDSNREQLVAAARLLRPLLGELVFVGGTADQSAGDVIDQDLLIMRRVP